MRSSSASGRATTWENRVTSSGFIGASYVYLAPAPHSIADRTGGHPTLKSGLSRGAREGDHVADVGHAGGVDGGPLQAQAESGMGHRTVAAQVAIPPVAF